MPFTREDVEELARRIWEAWRGRRVTLDRRGRPNYIVVRSLAWKLLDLADRVGVADPLNEVDWLAVLDPELPPTENLRLFASWVETHLGRKVEVADKVDRYITELERQIAWLRRELEEGRVPPEERPAVEEELRRLEEELERARRARRAEERRRRPTRRPTARPTPPPRAPPPPPRPPPPPPPRRVAEVPLEEARFSLESYLRRRVPRVYRVDWRDLRARVSYHRDAEADLRRAVEEVGGTVVRVAEARPPLRVAEVDFSGATLPRVELAPEYERYLLWSKFSAILLSRGVDPEDYRDRFEALLAEYAGRPLEEKQRAVEDLAARLAPPAVPAVPAEVLRRLESIERRLEALAEVGVWRPRRPEDIAMMIEALLAATPPEVVPRVDEEGHPFWGPSDRCLSVVRSVLDVWAVKWLTSCPECRYRLPGGALSPTEFVDHLIRVENAIPPPYQDWFRRLARVMEEAERRGIARA